MCAMAKIVLIEDDLLVRELLVSLLVRAGYEVIDFPDGVPALETGTLEDQDLIISDLNIPTGGEQFVQTVRKRGIHTPIIVVSGDLGKDVDHFTSIGVQATLSKPFSKDELLYLIQDLI